MDLEIRNGRVVRDDGKVAVLYSPGYGAGWSTWNPVEQEKFLFDPRLVLTVFEGRRDSITLEFLVNLGFEDDMLGLTVLGAGDLRIMWLPEGTQFTIVEFDGSESIITVTDLPFKT